MKTISGFTLAEVLITLGIIGIVAAMTIPALIANIQIIQYRSKFKKSVNILSNAARLAETQYGFNYAGITSICGSDIAAEKPDSTMSICSLLNGTLTGATPYNSLTDIKMKNGTPYSYQGGSFLNGEHGRTSNAFKGYMLNDGTIIAFYKDLGQYPCTLDVGTQLQDVVSQQDMAQCVGFIDVNGTAPPNKEVSCSSGSNSISQNTCIVKNSSQYLTDIYPIRFHDGIVEPASAAARYVLKTSK